MSVVEEKRTLNDYRKMVGNWLGKDKGADVDCEILCYHGFQSESKNYRWLVIRINLGPDRREKEEIKQDKGAELPEILTSVLAYIDDNLQEELSLASLEKRFFINRSYLSRLCRKYLGISLHRYIIWQRIAKAKELLAAGRSAMDACKEAGFNDYSNFRRMFKKITQVSPSAYAKSQLSKLERDRKGKSRNYP